jgi:hypothetical protein
MAAMWSDHRHPWSEPAGPFRLHVECACCSRLTDCASWRSAKSCANPRHFELHRTSRSVGNREDGIQPSDADVVAEPNVDRALGKVLGVHTSSSQLVRYRSLRVG